MSDKKTILVVDDEQDLLDLVEYTLKKEGFETDNFDFSLQTGSPALAGGETPPNDGFFEQVEFRGAFGTDDWTRSGTWVRWPN